MVTSAALQELQAFRSELYDCCIRRRDALFELVDALLTADSIPSLAYLSLEPIHRRGWGSTYAALATGQVDAEALRTLLAGQQLAGGQPIYAVDVSTWPRCDAEASPERGFYYHPSRHSAGQPIVAGWAFQWIAQLGLARDSWTAPVDARRLHPRDNANQVAITQVRALVERLPDGQGPLFVFDAGYDPVQLGQGLAGTGAAILVRLRAGRCFYADPPAPPAGKTGRPRRHGAKLDTDDPASWPAPTAAHVSDDGQFGTVKVAAWEGLHPKQQLHPTRGTKRPRPIVRGTLIRVQVSRIPARTRPPKVLWLVVARPRHARPGGAVAGLRAPLRPRAHHPLLQADPWLDHSKGAASRAGRAVDLARPGRLHPAPPRPSQHHRPAAAMGTAAAQHPADAGSRPPRVFAIALHGGFAGQCAKTLRALAGSTPRQPCRACQAVSGDQEDPVNHNDTPGAPPATTAALPCASPG